MRIAVWHNLNSGGGKRALYDHVKGLIGRGHQVVSYCPDTADQSYLPLSDLVEEKIFPLKLKVEKKVKGLKYFKSTDSVFEKFQAELEHCAECAKDIEANNFDLLFANSSTFFYMAHIGRFVNIPKLIYLGEPNRSLYESSANFVWRAPGSANISGISYLLKRAKHWYRMYWYSSIVREEYISACSYDLILVNSLYSRESVKRAYSLDSKVCYLGIDTEKFSENHQKKEPFVLGLGAIIPNKGLEQAILSLSLVKKSVRPKLVWIGNIKTGYYSDYITQYAKDNDVLLEIKTRVSDEELLDFLHKACVMLYFPHLEPFGLAPLEANACGTAVISIKEGGIKETVIHGSNGFTVNDFDPEMIASYVTKFVNDLSFSEKFGEQSREFIIQNWNLSKGIDNIENIMLGLLKNKSILK